MRIRMTASVPVAVDGLGYDVETWRAGEVHTGSPALSSMLVEGGAAELAAEPGIETPAVGPSETKVVTPAEFKELAEQAGEQIAETAVRLADALAAVAQEPAANLADGDEPAVESNTPEFKELLAGKPERRKERRVRK